MLNNFPILTYHGFRQYGSGRTLEVIVGEIYLTGSVRVFCDQGRLVLVGKAKRIIEVSLLGLCIQGHENLFLCRIFCLGHQAGTQADVARGRSRLIGVSKRCSIQPVPVNLTDHRRGISSVHQGWNTYRIQDQADRGLCFDFGLFCPIMPR